jgi:hypothetical protein
MTTRNQMARPNKNVVNGAAEDKPPLGEDQGLKKMFPKIQTLQKQAKLKNKDSNNLKNKFQEDKKNSKNVTQEQDKRHSNKE